MRISTPATLTLLATSLVTTHVIAQDVDATGLNDWSWTFTPVPVK